MARLFQLSNLKSLLGYLDNCLSWDVHIDELCTKLACRIGMFRRIRHHLNLRLRVLLYHGLVQSIMDYCCVVWGNTSKANLIKIYKLQKRMLRLILDVDNEFPSVNVFVQLKILPLDFRIQYFMALLTYQALSGIAPPYYVTCSNLIRMFTHTVLVQFAHLY